MGLSDSDRNLLFGDLAVRSGLVDSDELRRAETGWRQDSIGTLAEFLVSSAILNPAERDAVELLVDSQIRRKQAGESENPIPQDAIGTVQPGADSSTDDGRIPAPGSPNMPQTSGGETSSIRGRFSIIREHARGGLGVVSLATDNELNREVVLKEIRSELSGGGENQRRFLAEAEITGGLEHPGVVPVYGLGRDASGRPYYAMRFIRGESLAVVASRFHAESANRVSDAEEQGGEASQTSRRDIAFRKLCGRFVDVCNVIEYAHNRRIVHRDLKPDNIMLGDYGETIVVDWGLAKSIDTGDAAESPTGMAPLRSAAAADVAASTAGNVIGTPAFMSPEQALGWVDKISPATDVYCLGATLYYVLTGRAPFALSEEADSGIEDLLARVIEGRVDPPTHLNHSTPKPLAAICLKAMAVKPGARYRSARELADDIENWLADEPVSAYTEPITERIGRWSRRHRTLTTGVAVLLATSVIGLSVGLGAVKREQSRTEEKRVEAVNAQNEADHQAELAKDNAKHARTQNRLALETLDSVVFDIQRSLETVPGTETVRKHLLKTVITNLGKVARGLETAPLADHDLAVAYVDLGNIFLRIGSEPGLSATEEAEKLYRKSAKIFADLEKAGTEDPRVVFGRSSAWVKVGDVTVQRGKLNPAGDHYRKALQIVSDNPLAKKDAVERQLHFSTIHEKLGNVEREKGDLAKAEKHYSEKLRIDLQAAKNGNVTVEQQRNLAIAYDRIALLHIKRGKLTDAGPAYKQALTLRKKVFDAQPNNGQAKRDFIVSQLNLADVSKAKGEFAAARVMFEQALKLSREQRTAAPFDREVQRDISILCERLGDVCDKLKDEDASRKYFAEKLAIDKQLSGSDAGDARAKRDLSLAYERQGDAALKANDLVNALKFFRLKVGINQELTDADPDNIDDRRNFGIAHSKLGDVQRSGGDLSAATKSIERGFAIGEALVRKSPQDKQLQQDFSHYCAQLAELRKKSGDIVDARRLYQRKLDIDLKLVAADPANAEAKRRLAIAYDGLGDLDRLSQKLKPSLDYFKQALSIRRVLAGDGSRNDEATRELMASYGKVGSAAFMLGDMPTASRNWKLGFDIAHRLHADRPNETSRQYDLSNFCQRMGDVSLRTGDSAAARKYYERELALDRALVGAHPDSIAHHRGLAIALDRMGDYHFQTGDWKATDRFYRDSLKLRRKLTEKSTGNVQLLSDLMVSYAKIGNFENKRYRYADSANAWKNAWEVIERLGDVARGQPIMQVRLKLFRQRFSINRLGAKCVDDLQFALTQPEKQVPTLLGARGVGLAVLGKHVDAAKTAELLAMRESQTAKCRYQAARINGQCALAVLRETTDLKQPAESQRKLLTRYTTAAVQRLLEAEKLGYFKDRKTVVSFLRSRDFQAVQTDAEYVSLKKRLVPGSEKPAKKRGP